jgi:thiamine-monophosphate kinase
VIERLAEAFGRGRGAEVWAGDDAAVLAPPSRVLLVTTDMLVEGIDFELSYASGADVGFKALSTGVSDIAAMGGMAQRAVVSLGLSPSSPLSLLDALIEGLSDARARYGTDVVGGDISGSAELNITATVFGGTGERGPVLRSGARPGDAVCVTGSLGAAAGGLFVLRRGLNDPSLSISPERKEAFGRLVTRHLRPEARVSAGAGLAGTATSMIDLSDGLAMDLGHLTRAAGTGCSIDVATIPVDEDLKALAATVTDEAIDPLEAAITGGEDFELLFTVPAEAVQEARVSVGEAGVTVLGAMDDTGRVSLGDRSLESWIERSWEHLT